MAPATFRFEVDAGRGIILLAVAGCLVLSCTVATNSNGFSVGGLCGVCPNRLDLRHAPCRNPAGGDRGDGGVYFYALRAIDLGSNPSQWTDGYWIGLDQDCSDWPDGGPVLCSNTRQSGWVRLPGGIDNSLATRTFANPHNGAPLGDAMQAKMNQGVERGDWGLLLIIDGWNGAPDDNQVGARFLYSSGTWAADGGRGVPAWDGHDQWRVYSQGVDPANPLLPDAPVSGGEAYVAGGKLVWDGTAILGAKVRLENNAVVGVGAAEIGIANMALVGDITPEGIAQASLSGVISNSIVSFFPEFFIGGDAPPDAVCQFRQSTPLALSPSWAGATAADMPTPGFTGPASAPCSAASAGLGFQFVRTGGVGDPAASIPPPAAPTYRPFSCDAGADGG